MGLNPKVAQEATLFGIRIMVIKLKDNSFKIRVLKGDVWTTYLRIPEEDYKKYFNKN